MAPKVSLVTVGGVALYGALGMFAAPPAIRHLIISEAETRFGRAAKVGDISLNPFTMHVDIRDVHIADADGADAASFERLAVDLSPSSILRGGVALGEVRVWNPVLRIERRANGDINLSDFAPREKGTGLPKIWVDRLIVTGGRADLADLARPAPIHKSIDGIGFTLTGLSTAGEAIPFDLNARGDSGEIIAWSGKLTLDPFSSEGAFDLKNLPLPALSGWAGVLDRLSITSGKASLKGGYTLALDGAEPSLAVNLETASLRDLALHAEGARTDWIKAKALTFRDTKVDLQARSVAIGAIDLASPYLYFSRENDGSLNFDMLASKGAAAPQPAAPGLPWRLSAPRIRIADGTADVADRSTGAETSLRLTRITASADGFAWPARTPVAVDVSANAGEASRIAVAGTLALDPMAANLSVSAEKIDLAKLQPFISTAADMKVASGSATLAGSLAMTARAATFTGSASVEDFSASGAGEQGDLVRWRKLTADGVKLVTAPMAVSVATASLEAPYVRTVLDADAGLNLSRVLRTEEGSKADAPPTPLSIDTLSIEDGSLDFADLSVSPNVRLSLQRLSGSIGGLSSDPAKRADIRLAGMIDRFSPASITGRANYLSEKIYADLTLDLGKVQIPLLSPYAARFAGYELRRGTLDADLRYLIDGGKINADHHIVISNLQLGPHVQSKDAVDLPLPLAVALLTDSKGVIDINVPVEGSLDDPEFDLDAVLWKGIGNVVTGVVASPFTMLGALAGGNEKAGEIGFAPGAAELDEAAKASLARLGSGLAARPNVNLNVPVTFDAVRDRAALAAAAAPPASADPAAAPVAPPEISDDDLEALGQARAAAVQQALLSGGALDPGRVLIVRQPTVSGKDGPVEMKLAVTR